MYKIIKRKAIPGSRNSRDSWYVVVNESNKILFTNHSSTLEYKLETILNTCKNNFDNLQCFKCDVNINIEKYETILEFDEKIPFDEQFPEYFI